jgi:hypothetical protein
LPAQKINKLGILVTRNRAALSSKALFTAADKHQRDKTRKPKHPTKFKNPTN